VLSIRDPDLGWTDEVQRSPERIVCLTLHGEWPLDDPAQARVVGTEPGRTTIEVTCGDGCTVEVRPVRGTAAE